MEEIVLEAKLLHVIYHNDTNGFSVLKFVTYDASEDDFIATGFFKDISDDVIYRLYGGYTDHYKYGLQFKVRMYEKVMPKDDQSLIRFFSSSLFPGIGPKLAAKLIDVLGSDAIERIKEDKDVLYMVPGLSDKKREAIINGIHEHDDVDDTTFFFTKLGISVKNIMKFEAAYGEQAIAIIKENPYRLIEDIDGIGFKTADKLASELAFPKDHPYRYKAATLSMVLELCMRNGDTYITYDELSKAMYKNFQIIDIDDYLLALVNEQLLYRFDECIYHHTQYESEQGIVHFLSAFPYEEQKLIQHDDLLADIKSLEKELHITYEEKQKEAMLHFFDEPFAILTGGPGTGKTTIVQGILKLYKRHFPLDQIAVCAPTGRASKRLSEVCECDACTIHSLLRWDLESNTFLVNEKEPIQADLLIIDEFSMVDQWLFYNLLKASKLVKRILIIGDEDQLASVGCGCVLKDLIASDLFMVTRLSKIFRQSQGSDVITLAHEIRNEEVSILHNANDVAFFPAQNFEVRDLVVSVVNSALEKGYESKDIQVLAPMYSGVAGIDALNMALQKMMNPPSEKKRELKVGYRVFREYDKVLQLKNQPDDDVYNGDIGEIVEIYDTMEGNDKKQVVVVDYDGNYVEYSADSLFNITHAFCISIHKSQGSEYPIVIIPIVKDYSYMLSKRLLYTAITRAKKSLVLLGNEEVFLRAIKRSDRHLRRSTLTQALQAQIIR